MSIWKNGKLVAGGSQALPLLSFVWADHILDDISWLRADTFSWQNGSVYQAVYQHLANDIDGKSLQSETIGGTTIQFYLADDGHKVCPASEESNVVAIYNTTGVAWYYIIDTVNEQFKLPRTKWGVTGLRDTVGNYVNQNVVLPKMEGVFSGGKTKTTYTGPFYLHSTEGSAYPTGTNTAGNVVGFDTSRLNSVYSGNGTNTLVQPRATQMYLYFYVGQFTQTALENTAGVVTEDFNELNAHKVIAFQAPTAENNYTWYRKYADGWVEQGGYNQNNATPTTVTLPIPMADTYYTATANSRQNGYTNTPDGVNRNTVMNWAATICEQTTTTLSIRGGASESNYTGYNWRVEGMAA